MYLHTKSFRLYPRKIKTPNTTTAPFRLMLYQSKIKKIKPSQNKQKKKKKEEEDEWLREEPPPSSVPRVTFHTILYKVMHKQYLLYNKLVQARSPSLQPSVVRKEMVHFTEDTWTHHSTLHTHTRPHARTQKRLNTSLFQKKCIK